MSHCLVSAKKDCLHTHTGVVYYLLSTPGGYFRWLLQVATSGGYFRWLLQVATPGGYLVIEWDTVKCPD